MDATILTPTKLEQAKHAAARKFGRVDSDGKVFVKIVEQEHQVGQYSTGEIDSEMTLFTTRFVDQVEKMELFAKRLETAPNITAPEIDSAISSFKQFGEEYNAVGDYVALLKHIIELEKLGEIRKQTNKERREETLAKTLEILTSCVDKVEEIANRDLTKINWASAGSIADEAFATWQEVQGNVRIPKTVIDELWKRFQTARQFIITNKREFFTSKHKNDSEVQHKKGAIIREAEAVKETNNFDAGKRTFSRLFNNWKEIGHGNKSTDDKQWKEFNDIRNYFYNRLPKDEKPIKSERPKWNNNLSNLSANIGGLDALAQLRDQLTSKSTSSPIEADSSKTNASIKSPAKSPVDKPNKKSTSQEIIKSTSAKSTNIDSESEKASVKTDVLENENSKGDAK